MRSIYTHILYTLYTMLKLIQRFVHSLTHTKPRNTFNAYADGNGMEWDGVERTKSGA